LKKINRTLLEMWTGIIVLGAVLWLGGTVFFGGRWMYAKSLWFGILLALVSTVHMYITLDRGLELDEKRAQKAIFRGYVIRYVFILIIFAIIMATRVLTPLVVFMSYMTLKVTALIQPITHKCYNRLFSEEDPVPTPESQET
jgi:signal transduction histidine kinase